jgi:surface antigen
MPAKRFVLRWLPILLAVALAGCAGSRAGGANLASASRYPGLNCAPFARELTGLHLYGDAGAWWSAANGRYARSSQPEVGGVLVFRPTARLRSGHVSVVSRLLGERRIHVIQANWVPGELDVDQLVVDVSQANDWSAVRVWYPPTGQMGVHVYPTYGFILPLAPTTHDNLARAAEPAAARASGG